jgi:hypothetical protein
MLFSLGVLTSSPKLKDGVDEALNGMGLSKI